MWNISAAVAVELDKHDRLKPVTLTFLYSLALAEEVSVAVSRNSRKYFRQQPIFFTRFSAFA